MAKLHFYYSAMNAGKSTVLLQSAHNYTERGMSCILYSPSIDDRYGSGIITSRIGLSAPAFAVTPELDLFSHIKNRSTPNKAACVLIDEAHFLSKEQVKQCGRVVDELSIPILTYGLRSDFRGEPFSGSQYLLATADQLVEIKTICHCGSKATMNMRVDKSGRRMYEGEQIQIGGNELYVATCRRHFEEGISGITIKEILIADDGNEPLDMTGCKYPVKYFKMNRICSWCQAELLEELREVWIRRMFRYRRFLPPHPY